MNIKKILSDFGSWIFAGLTFLGFIIIYAGIGGRGRYNPVWCRSIPQGAMHYTHCWA